MSKKALPILYSKNLLQKIGQNLLVWPKPDNPDGRISGTLQFRDSTVCPRSLDQFLQEVII